MTIYSLVWCPENEKWRDPQVNELKKKIHPALTEWINCILQNELNQYFPVKTC